MAVLERINQMRQQGLSDTQISKTLEEEKFSPQQISEGLSQSQIKSAIEQPPTQTPNSMQPAAGAAGMQPSIAAQNPAAQTAQPVPEQAQAQPQASALPQMEQGKGYSQVYAQEAGAEAAAYPDQGQAYPESQYQDQSYTDQSYGQYPQDTYYQQAMDSETVREIAKQAIEEELGKLKDQMQEVVKLKTDLKFQIENIDNRLKEIEATIQELQSAIIKKIGSYGDAISDISNELKATQDSFGKLVNPIVDAKRKTSIASSTKPKPKSKKASSSKASRSPSTSGSGFEDYFR